MTARWSAAAQYSPGERLAYAASAWTCEPGARLTFDDAYRLGHLPLVAPEHPLVIHSVQHSDYAAGRYERRRFSLVVPVDAVALTTSATFQAMDRDLAGRSLGGKIAWELIDRRADRLHATLVSGLAEEDIPALAARVAAVMRELGPLRFRVGGPFVGTRNRGRLYLPLFPELLESDDAFALLQETLGAIRTRLYVVGYYNLLDELTAAESADLIQFLSTWADATLAELTAESVLILGTHDDLALDSEVIARIG